MVVVTDVSAVLSPFWSLSLVNEVNNAVLSSVWSTGSGCRVLCVLTAVASQVRAHWNCSPHVVQHSFLETQYINYIRRYKSIFLTEWCVSIIITKLGRPAGILRMLQAHFCRFYVEQMQWVRQEGLSQTVRHVSEEPAADGQKEIFLLQAECSLQAPVNLLP